MATVPKNEEGVTIRVVNGSDGVTYTSPNTFTLNLPNGWVSNHESMALSQLYVYYSWRNITAALGNNSVSYIWNSTTYAVNFTDGAYQYSDFSNYIQQVMLANGHYLVDNTGTNRFYISLQANSVSYAVSLTCTPFPSSLPSGWSNPAGATFWGQTPQLIVPNTAVATYLGYAAGTYPAAPQATTYNTNSTSVPQVTQVTTVNISCSELGSNNLSMNSRILATFSPSQLGTTFGSLISYVPVNPDYMPAFDGIHTQISLSFVDQLNRVISLIDTTGAVFVLKIRKTN